MDMTPGGGILLHHRKNGELAHRPAVAEHSVEVLASSWVDEPGNLDGLLNFETIGFVLNLPEVGNCKDPL